MNIPAELGAIRERVTNLESMSVELLPYKVVLTPAEEDRARLLDAVEKVLAKVQECQEAYDRAVYPHEREYLGGGADAAETIADIITTALEGK
jgi:hypothetical protein